MIESFAKIAKCCEPFLAFTCSKLTIETLEQGVKVDKTQCGRDSGIVQPSDTGNNAR